METRNLQNLSNSRICLPCGSIERRPNGDIPNDGNPHIRVGLQTKWDDRHHDEENRNDSDNLKIKIKFDLFLVTDYIKMTLIYIKNLFLNGLNLHSFLVNSKCRIAKWYLVRILTFFYLSFH